SIRKKCRFQPRPRFQSVSSSELSPTHASLRSTTSIMIASSNSPLKGEQSAQSIARCSTAHQRLFRACLRADRTCSTAGNPIACATSSTDERGVCVQCPPGRSSVLVAWPGEKPCSATRDRFVPWPALLPPGRNALSHHLVCLYVPAFVARHWILLPEPD